MKNGRALRSHLLGLLAKEKGSVLLEKGAMLRIALVYPNRYAVGMASLGFQTVYGLFNVHPPPIDPVPLPLPNRTLGLAEQLPVLRHYSHASSYQIRPHFVGCKEWFEVELQEEHLRIIVAHSVPGRGGIDQSFEACNVRL